MPNLVNDIIIDGLTYTVLFRRILCPGERKYFVSCYHRIEEQVSFEMKHNYQGKWKMMEPAPLFLKKYEELFSGWIYEAELGRQQLQGF